MVASTKPYHAFLAALLCRGVHAKLETNAQKSAGREVQKNKNVEQNELEAESQVSTTYTSLKDWEGLSMEMVEWNLVLWQLECLLPLSQLLTLSPPNGPERQPALEVSIKSLMDRGKGQCYCMQTRRITEVLP